MVFIIEKGKERRKMVVGRSEMRERQREHGNRGRGRGKNKK